VKDIDERSEEVKDIVERSEEVKDIVERSEEVKDIVERSNIYKNFRYSVTRSFTSSNYPIRASERTGIGFTRS